MSLGEDGRDVLGLDGRDHDAVVSVFPVDGGGDLVVCGELEGVDHTEDLVEVSAGGGGVGHDQLDLLVVSDDEDRAHGERVVVLRVDHVVQRCHLLGLVANDREVHLRALRLVDVLNPLPMACHVVNAHRNHLAVPLVKLRLQLGGHTKLGGAHRGEVLRVAEQDAPSIAEVLVEGELTVGGVCGEVGCDVSESKDLGGCHCVERVLFCRYYSVYCEDMIGMNNKKKKIVSGVADDPKRAENRRK